MIREVEFNNKKNMAIASIVALLLFGCSPKITPTVEMTSPIFGTPSKAEFYPIQMNPRSSEGTFLLGNNSGEVLYIEPSPIVNASDITDVTILNSSTGSNRKRVDIQLNQTGINKIKSYISSTSSDHRIALVWQNHVYFTYIVKAFDTTQSIVVADSIEADFADELQNALQ